MVASLAVLALPLQTAETWPEDMKRLLSDMKLVAQTCDLRGKETKRLRPQEASQGHLVWVGPCRDWGAVSYIIPGDSAGLGVGHVRSSWVEIGAWTVPGARPLEVRRMFKESAVGGAHL